MFKFNNKTQNDVTDTYFTPFCSFSIADFEKVNVSWEGPIDLNLNLSSECDIPFVNPSLVPSSTKNH